MIPPNKAEVSKVDYSSKDKSSNVHYFCLPIGIVLAKILLNLVVLPWYTMYGTAVGQYRRSVDLNLVYIVLTTIIHRVYHLVYGRTKVVGK